MIDHQKLRNQIVGDPPMIGVFMGMQRPDPFPLIINQLRVFNGYFFNDQITIKILIDMILTINDILH